MQAYGYLIVGGGMTADAACRGIRGEDGDGAIGLVSAEQHAPWSQTAPVAFRTSTESAGPEASCSGTSGDESMRRAISSGPASRSTRQRSSS